MNGFTELVVLDKDWKIVWDYIDEGNSGEYNEADPTDCPRLRFWVYFGDEERYSFCTLATTKTPTSELIGASLALINMLKFSAGKAGHGVKKLLEEFTHTKFTIPKPGPKRYLVQMTALAEVKGVIEIEAETQEEAEKKAREKSGDVEWGYQGTQDDTIQISWVERES